MGEKEEKFNVFFFRLLDKIFCFKICLSLQSISLIIIKQNIRRQNKNILDNYKQ